MDQSFFERRITERTSFIFMRMHGTKKDLEAVIKVAEGAGEYVDPVHMMRASTWGLNMIGVDQHPVQVQELCKAAPTAAT